MQRINDISKYKIIGTLSNSSDFSAWIASYVDDKGINKMCLINRFSHNKANQSIFKDLFSWYSSDKCSKDMINFFSSKDSFYVIFNYTKGEQLSEKFRVDKTTLDYQTRCSILKSTLLKIDNFSSLPMYITLCLADYNNICIDNDNNVCMVYNLSRLKEFKDGSQDLLYKKLSDIISIILNHELSGKYYGQLKIVLEKCNNNLYSSIPELIFELERAEQIVSSNNNNFIGKIKKYIESNKEKVKRYSIIGGSILAVCVCIFLIPFAIKLYNSQTGPVVTVGNIKYNVTSEQEAKIGIKPIELDISSDINEDDLNYAVSSDSGLSSEDYVVQYGDTIATICANNYSSQKFVTTIETFNNISDAGLVSGMIIKLPNETAVINYIAYK